MLFAFFVKLRGPDNHVNVFYCSNLLPVDFWTFWWDFLSNVEQRFYSRGWYVYTWIEFWIIALQTAFYCDQGKKQNGMHNNYSGSKPSQMGHSYSCAIVMQCDCAASIKVPTFMLCSVWVSGKEGLSAASSAMHCSTPSTYIRGSKAAAQQKFTHI